MPQTGALPTELQTPCRWGGRTRIYEAERRQIYSLLSFLLRQAAKQSGRWRTPQCRVEPRGVEPRYLDFQSSAYTTSAKVPSAEAKGFEPLRRFRLPVFKTGAIDQLCQTSISSGSRRIRTFGALRLGTLAMCWYQPLTHASIFFRVQR